MGLQDGPAGRGADSGQERVATLQPVVGGSGYAESDRHAAGVGGGTRGGGGQAGAQGRSAGDEKTQQDHRGARGAAPGSVGTTLAGNGSDRGRGATDFGADQDGCGEVACGDSPGA